MKFLTHFTKTKYSLVLTSTFTLLGIVILVLAILNFNLRARVRNIDIVGDAQHAAVSGQKIILHFNQPMDKNSVIAALQITPSVKFDVGWGLNSLLISFRDNLEANTKYALKIDKAARDIYGEQLAADFTYEFTTKQPTFVYLERNYLVSQQPDRVIRTTIDNQQDELFTGDDIDLFSANADYLAVSLNNAAGDSSLKLVNLTTKVVTDIPLQSKHISKLIFSPTSDQFIYAAQDVTTSDSGAIPTSGNNIYLYQTASQQTKHLDPQQTAEDVADAVFAPDGNGVLYRGDDGTYYLIDINNPDNLVMIGKHFATGGFNHSSDRIVFVDYDPLAPGVSYPYVNVLNTNRDNISLTKGESFVVDPDFFHNSNQIAISEEYQELEGTKGLFKIVILGDDGKPETEFKVGGSSLELPKVSLDDRYILAEKYNQDDLMNYQNMRSFVFQTKPYSATLVLYDLQEKKFLDVQWSGVDAMWEN